MNSSSRRTSARRATAISRDPARVQWIPSTSQVSANSALMSSLRLLNEYRAYSRMAVSAPITRDEPTAVGVNETAEERLRVCVHRTLLPAGKLDRALVLASDAVLRD